MYVGCQKRQCAQEINGEPAAKPADIIAGSEHPDFVISEGIERTSKRILAYRVVSHLDSKV